MKIQVEIHDLFAQDLLMDDQFKSELSLIYNDTNITELWFENKVIDNEEIIFRAQVLEIVKKHYCRINNSDSKYLEISYDSNIPKEILFTGPKYRLGSLAKIKTVKNE